MAAVRVSKQFKDDFDTWAQRRVEAGEWGQAEINGLKDLFRNHELAEGPDTLRYKGAKIDNVADRVRLWEAYFAEEARIIRHGAATA